MPYVGFEPTIPAFEGVKTVHALDDAATVIGCTISAVLKTGCNRYISNWTQTKLTHKGMRFGVFTTVNVTP
jgi:hypothetical protein